MADEKEKQEKKPKQQQQPKQEKQGKKQKAQFKQEVEQIAPEANPKGDNWRPGDAPSLALTWVPSVVPFVPRSSEGWCSCGSWNVSQGGVDHATVGDSARYGYLGRYGLRGKRGFWSRAQCTLVQQRSSKWQILSDLERARWHGGNRRGRERKRY